MDGSETALGNLILYSSAILAMFVLVFITLFVRHSDGSPRMALASFTSASIAIYGCFFYEVFRTDDVEHFSTFIVCTVLILVLGTLSTFFMCLVHEALTGAGKLMDKLND